MTSDIKQLFRQQTRCCSEARFRPFPYIMVFRDNIRCCVYCNSCYSLPICPIFNEKSFLWASSWRLVPLCFQKKTTQKSETIYMLAQVLFRSDTSRGHYALLRTAHVEDRECFYSFTTE